MRIGGVVKNALAAIRDTSTPTSSGLKENGIVEAFRLRLGFISALAAPERKVGYGRIMSKQKVCRKGSWKGRKLKQEQRICKTCGKKFWFRLCYAKRPGKPGTYCSNSCRAKQLYGQYNPNISELGKVIGPKAAKGYRYKERQQAIRLEAITLLRPELTCCICGCDRYEMLEINHIFGKTEERKTESGYRLWQLVIKLKEKAKEQFDVRCSICNWLNWIERKFMLNGTEYTIVWNKTPISTEEKHDNAS